MENRSICEYCHKEFSKYGIKNHIEIVHLGNIKRVQGNKGKHQVAWNKGLTKETDERVKKYSELISVNTKGENSFWFGKTHSIESKEKISKGLKKFCEDINNRKRLRDIGRKGGFGKKGYTKLGTYYASIFEKQCFEYLEENNIKFEAHKELPNSSKVSDIYLIENNLWVELDGINREAKKKYIGKNYNNWLDKIDLYKTNNMNYVIVYTFEEFKHLFI